MAFFSVDQTYWRPYEKEAALKHLGEQVNQNNFDKADVLIWRFNTEAVNPHMLNEALSWENQLPSSTNIINPVNSFVYTDQKEECFKKWEEEGISCPKSFAYQNREDFENKKFDYPYLIRINDRATGENTYLIENDNDLETYFPKLEDEYHSLKRIGTKKICVEFIDTSIENGWKTSFRIHVAGNKVISGYGRISKDWLAISSKFEENMKDVFVEQNKRVQKLINENHDEIVRAVTCLGLHHQGLDVIADTSDKIYFLEVQPFYFSGRKGLGGSDTLPPFWNPYKPQNLVDWLIKEKLDLYKEIPLYYDNWLSKENHFDLCYKNLKEYFDVRS